MEHTVDL